MGMDPMGGDASFMPPAPGADPMMGTDPDGGVVGEQGDPGDPNAMADPNAMGGDPNAPVMGANPFNGGEGDADVSGDPEKKAESLAGQLASIFRNDLKSDGINSHEDKKKEVLGMIASAIVDGMNDEDKNSMIEYLSDKLNGSGESDGDDEDDDNTDQDMGGEDQGMEDPNAMGGDPSMMGGDPNQQMVEKRVKEVVSNIIKEMTDKHLTQERIMPSSKPNDTKNKVKQKQQKGYKSFPYSKEN